jgi:hypothetical protein
MREIKLSTTAVSCFKTCPMKYFYRYILRIMPELESESQRFGTNWHRIMEILGGDPLVSEQTGEVTTQMDLVIAELNATYDTVPGSVDSNDWMAEKIKLLYSAYAYVKLNSDKPMNVLACEVPFDMPLTRDGRKVRGISLVGKIDKLLLETNGLPRILILDHKATGRSIEDDADFWKKFAMDLQTRFYPYALRELSRTGQLQADGCGIGVLIDAFHKPQISPKKLTQGDSKKFVTDGEYCGNTLSVEIKYHDADTPPVMYAVLVNGVVAEIEPGAKEGTFAIRETPDMFGARLIQDILTRPDYYFQRREIPRTDPELDNFGVELHGIVVALRAFERMNLWYKNENACEATFKCEYCSLCYNNVDPTVEKNLPGFIRKPIK